MKVRLTARFLFKSSKISVSRLKLLIKVGSYIRVFTV